VDPPVTDPKLIDALSKASNVDLFMLSTVIQRMLDDPRRIMATRINMHLGQTVRFVDYRDGQMRSGHVVAMKDTQVVLHETGTRVEWKLPYTAIEPPAPGEAGPPAATAATPPKPERDDFQRGDRVSFQDKHFQNHIGTIVRINQKRASVDVGDGGNWLVPFSQLRQVLDV
jgi:hypothetical protein